MRKSIILISAVILLIVISGCQALIPTFMDTTESSEKAVNQANAGQIAIAYNAYRALNPNDTDIGMEKSDFKNAEELHTAIGDDLWPRGLSAEGADAAWPWLTITDGAAEVKQ